MDEVRVVREGERQQAAADQTQGMQRGEAFSSDGFWIGFSTVSEGAETGWHHHGDYESYLYIVGGEVRFEYGPAGEHGVAAGPGDFVHVPAHLVHREMAPSGGAAVVVRSGGHGPSTINVESPSGT